MSDEIQKNTEAMEGLTNEVNATAAGQEQYNEILAQTQKEASERQNQLGAAWKDAKQAVSSFGSAMLSSEQGQAKYGSAVTSATGAISGVAKSFGPFGIIIGTVVDIFGKIVGAALDLNDATVKNYDELSKLGINLGSTSSELLDSAHTAGYNSKNLERMQAAVHDLGPALRSLGSSSAEGFKKFSNIANVSDEELIRFRKLGYSNEDLKDTMAQYVRTSSYSNMLRGKSDEEVRSLSLEYAENLTAVAALTGLSRKKQQNILDESNKELNYTIAKNQLAGKKNVSGADVVDAMDKLVVFTGQYGTDVTSGIRDLLSAGGQVTSDAAAQLVKQTNGEAIEIAKLLTAGKIDDATASVRLQRALEVGQVNIDKFSTGAANGAVINSEAMQKFYGASAESYSAVKRNKGLTEEKYRETMDNIKSAEKSRRDGLMDSVARQQVAEKNFKQASDKSLKSVGEGLSSAIANMTAVFNGVIDWAVKFGAPDPRKGSPNENEIQDTKVGQTVASAVEMVGGSKAVTDKDYLKNRTNLDYLKELSSDNRWFDFGQGDARLKKFVEGRVEQGTQFAGDEVEYLKTKGIDIPKENTASLSAVQQKGARDGGVFVGDSSGYSMKLHGTEAVIPMGTNNSIGVSEYDNGDSEVMQIVNNMLERLTSLMEENSRLQTDMMRTVASGGV